LRWKKPWPNRAAPASGIAIAAGRRAHSIAEVAAEGFTGRGAAAKLPTSQWPWPTDHDSPHPACTVFHCADDLLRGERGRIQSLAGPGKETHQTGLFSPGISRSSKSVSYSCSCSCLDRMESKIKSMSKGELADDFSDLGMVWW